MIMCLYLEAHMEQPTDEREPESKPAEDSGAAETKPEESPGVSIEELMKLLKEDGWDVNPGEVSTILPEVDQKEANPEKKEDWILH
jgi:hypothetical protein